MSEVNIGIAGRRHRLRCRPDERAALERAAAEMDRRAARIAAAVGPVDEARLLLMVGLELADELAAGRGAPEGAGVALATRLETLATRLEQVARLAGPRAAP